VVDERTEQQILHHLIDVCENGERGFLAATDHVTHPGLKTLFTELSGERAQFAAELLPHLQRLGGRSDHGGTSAGTLHRGWIGLKSLLSGPHHDHAVVTEAERGEQLAIDAYDEALSGMLPPTVISLIERQRDTMKEDNERIRSIDMGYS
jgi:uncharacterized protein (TIGR02284 family)